MQQILKKKLLNPEPMIFHAPSTHSYLFRFKEGKKKSNSVFFVGIKIQEDFFEVVVVAV